MGLLNVILLLKFLHQQSHHHKLKQQYKNLVDNLKCLL